MPRTGIIRSIKRKIEQRKRVTQKTTFLFPGQGKKTIAVGMGLDLFLRSSAAREVFWKIDSHLKRPFSHLCFFGPEEELLSCSNAQLGSLSVNLACIAAQDQLNKEETDVSRIIRPTHLAGHSVGYIATLVYAKVITLQQAAGIVKERGRLMKEACGLNPGTMIALLRPKTVEVEALRQRLGLGGNFNSESEIILSGPNEKIAKALKEIKQKFLAAKVIEDIGVEGGFHSECMSSVVGPLTKFIEPIHFRDPDPAVKIIGNSQAQIITTGEAAKKELIDHICLPVLWQASMKSLREMGVTSFIEVGNGEVLLNNLKRDFKDGVVIHTLYSLIKKQMKRHRRRKNNKSSGKINATFQ